MNTISIKTKPFLWFSVFLVVLAVLGLCMVYVTTDIHNLQKQSLILHRLHRRSVDIENDTQGNDLSNARFTRQFLTSKAPQTSNPPINKTEIQYEIHISTINKTSERLTPGTTTNANFRVSVTTNQPKKFYSSTAEEFEARISKTTNPPKSSHTEALAEAAKVIWQQKGVVLFTLINDAYLDFAASWLCNTAPMTGLQQHVLFLTTDPHTASILKTLSPHIHVVSLNASQFSGNQVYSHAGYVRLMVERTRQILYLLEMGIPLLLFEVDCVWLSNPLPLLMSESKDRDIIATKVENRTAGGFLLLNPTLQTLTLWRRLTAQMDDLFHNLHNRSDSSLVFWELNDQEYLSELIRDKFGGVRVSHLSEELFPDGKWYYRPEEERQLTVRPVIINNNFVSGNGAKRRRAQQYGHWFLTEDSTGGRGFSCSSSAVHTVVHTGP